jgi:hypothetical protein
MDKTIIIAAWTRGYLLVVLCTHRSLYFSLSLLHCFNFYPFFSKFFIMICLLKLNGFPQNLLAPRDAYIYYQVIKMSWFLQATRLPHMAKVTTWRLISTTLMFPMGSCNCIYAVGCLASWPLPDGEYLPTLSDSEPQYKNQLYLPRYKFKNSNIKLTQMNPTTQAIYLLPLHWSRPAYCQILGIVSISPNFVL